MSSYIAIFSVETLSVVFIKVPTYGGVFFFFKLFTHYFNSAKDNPCMMTLRFAIPNTCTFTIHVLKYSLKKGMSLWLFHRGKARRVIKYLPDKQKYFRESYSNPILN